jgi:hypothetical protein
MHLTTDFLVRWVIKAGIAQLVERNLAKVEVASSNLATRSNPEGCSQVGLISPSPSSFLLHICFVISLNDDQVIIKAWL